MAKKRNAFPFLIYVKNGGYAASLEVRKVYEAIPDDAAAANGLVRIVDEFGEDYLYPEDYLVPIRVPPAATKAFVQAS